MKNNLTEKIFWSDSWRGLNLPARFLDDYSHKVSSNVIEKYISSKHKYFLEIGGCPGRWADYFFTKHKMVCDSMDYTEENINLTNKNYKLLGINGKAFLGDITDLNLEKKRKYDIVLSDGLFEHFIDSGEVFKNHTEFLNSEGILIIGVPNIKQSLFYNFFSKFDKISYEGYRHVSKKELQFYATRNKLEVMFCDYVGVFNVGLINTSAMNFFIKKIITAVYIFSFYILRIFNVKKETKLFSPYIYLIAKKND